MICKYCHSEISDNAKFCPECGMKVEMEDQAVEVKEEPAISLYSQETEDYMDSVAEEVEQEVISDGQVKNWYYIASGQTVGPFSETEMLSYIHDGTVTKNTYVWKEGDADWRYASNSLLGNFFEDPSQSTSYLYEETSEGKEEWYYADNGNNQHGPYTEKDMVKMIQAGKISPKNYVWKPGLSEWIFLNESNLSGYSKQEAPRASTQNYTNTTRTNTATTGIFKPAAVINRSIALQIVLSIVTCGLYSIYWLYTIVKDFNSIATSQGKQPVFDAALATLLTIVTCGLFSFYLFWKMGNTIGTCKNKYGNRMEDTGIVMTLLAIFGLSIVSMCIAQSQINECA